MKPYAGSIGLAIVVLLSLPLLVPLTHTGYFPMHDDTQIVRVNQMAIALSEGQFPVRWVGGLGYGYGYPIFNFYSPLPYYAGGLFVLSGFSALVATKIMFGLGILLSGVTMYCLGKKLWGVEGGIIASLLYQYAPYHAVNIYVRGAVGEYWAMAWIPLVFLGIVGCLQREHVGRYVVLGAVGYAGVILSHNITAMLLSGLLLPVLLYDIAHKQFPVVRMLGLGLGISAFFWLPAMVEMNYTNVDKIIGGTADVRNHFVYIDQLWNSPWGFAGSAPGREDGMSFKVGKLHVLAGIVGFASILFAYVRSSSSSRSKKTVYALLSGLYCLAVLIISVYMTTAYSTWIWDVLPMLSFVQYPWRLLVFMVFSLSVMGAGICMVSTSGAWKVLVGCLGLVIIWVNYSYFRPQEYYPISEETYTSNGYIKWRTSKISDEYLPKGFSVPSSELLVPTTPFTSDEADITITKDTSITKEARVVSDVPSDVTVHVAYFPGWTVFVDGGIQQFSLTNGRMTVYIPEGSHIIRATFNNTPVRILGNIVSLLSLAVLFGTIIRTRKSVWQKKQALK